MKQLITVVLLILFSVSIVYALDEQSRCGLGENCNFVWDVVNNSNKAQKIVSPCNVTVYNGTYIEIWSVLSQVTNTWHNVSIPTNTFGVGYYYAERLCNETISSFNFQINTTLSNLDALVNVSINGSIGEAVWTYNFSDSMTAMAYVEGNDMSFFAVAIFLTAALFLYLAFNLKGDYKILQILFLFLTIYMIIFGFGYMAALSNTWGLVDAEQLSTAMMWIGILVMLVMVFYIIMLIIKQLPQILKHGRMDLSQ